MQVQPLGQEYGAIVKSSGDEPVDALEHEEVIRIYKSSGAVYLQGFKADLKAIGAFTNRFSDDYMDNTGSSSYRKTADAGTDSTIQNVAYVYGVNKQRTFGVPLHADRAYMKSQRPLIWFLCVRPAEGEGQTTVCDGVLLYGSLSGQSKKLFAKKRIKYIRHYPVEEWQVFFRTKDVNRDGSRSPATPVPDPARKHTVQQGDVATA